jgi:hypothetical protein
MATMMASKENTNSDDCGGAIIKSSLNNMLLLQVFEGKYRWTSIATLLSFLLHIVLPFSNSNNNPTYNKHDLIDNIFFTTILWVYSHMIDALFGGAIGMAHVALGGLSMILRNHKLRTAMYRLGGEWRLKKLNQHIFATGGGGTDDVYIDPLKAVRPVRLPVLLSTSGTIVTAIANGMGSASLLISFPQYFLGLYMLGSSFISWWSKTNRQSNDGYFIGRFVQWLGEEGTLSCSRYTNDATTTTTGGCGLGGHIDSPWKLSTRLVALYWITILSKTLLAFIVICRNDATGSTR